MADDSRLLWARKHSRSSRVGITVGEGVPILGVERNVNCHERVRDVAPAGEMKQEGPILPVAVLLEEFGRIGWFPLIHMHFVNAVVRGVTAAKHKHLSPRISP